MQKPVCNGLAFLLFILCFTACERYDPNKTSQTQSTNQSTQKVQQTPGIITDDKPVKSDSLLNPGLPAIKPNEQIVKHMAYTLSYNEEHEIANWVAYTLKAGYLQGKEKRSDDFREDPAVRTLSAELEDYRQSGYDRGHLVPAADMKWSRKAMSETFLLSNIAPQAHAFNSGIWEKLESAVRNWAKKDSTLYIVTGPIFQGETKTIGKNKVTVPPYFYKAVLDITEPEIKSVAFVIPNKGLKNTYWDYAISVDSLEKIIDIDLFSGLPDDIEKETEKSFSGKAWKSQAKNTSRKRRK